MMTMMMMMIKIINIKMLIELMKSLRQFKQIKNIIRYLHIYIKNAIYIHHGENKIHDDDDLKLHDITIWLHICISFF